VDFSLQELSGSVPELRDVAPGVHKTSVCFDIQGMITEKAFE